MKKSFFTILSASLVLVACQSNVSPLATAPRVNPTLQAASAPTIPQIKNPSGLPQDASQADPLYSYRKPVGGVFVDLYNNSDRDMVTNHIKDFFRKYVDKNDIVNYQFVNVDNTSDQFRVNIYGGNHKFVNERILPDLVSYVNQRARFDKIYNFSY
jgi:hypothetical protein